MISHNSRRWAALTLAAALATTSGSSISQAAAVGPAPVAAAAGSTSGGVAATSGLIGIATFLGIYDLVRRTSCSGDPLRLGGPGFTSPIRPSDNVLPPQCRTAPRP